MTSLGDGRLSDLVDAAFGDVDHFCDAIRSWSLDFRPLRRVIASGPIARIAQSRLGGIELAHAQLQVSLDQVGMPPSSKLTFIVLEDGMRRLWWRRHDVDRDTVLVFPVGSELSCVSGPDFHIHSVSIDEATVGEIGATLQLELPPASARSECFKPPANVLRELRRLLRRLGAAPPATSMAEAGRVTELLVSSWLISMQRSHGLYSPERGRDAAVRRCLGRMEDMDWSEVDVAAFRQVSGLSERSLQYAFRERFGLTPAAFIKARRLAAVRRDLLDPREGRSSVADISSLYGFWHVGQFAADYRRLFRELPSETLARSPAGGGRMRA